MDKIKSFEDLERQIVQFREEKAVLENKLANEQAANTRLAAQRNELQDKYNCLVCENEELKSTIETAEERIEELRRKCGSDNDELQDVLIANNRLRVTVQTLVSIYGGKIL